MTIEELAQKIESMKGLAGSGTVLGETIKKLSDFVGTLEPGDIVQTNSEKVSAAPIAYDLWYLTYHQNVMRKYYAEGTDFKHYDYSTYISENLSFLSYLYGLKPLKVLTDLKEQLHIVNPGEKENSWDYVNWFSSQYSSNGIYWINTAFFELRLKNLPIQYSSEGSPGFKSNPNNYVGYIAFPIGQLGVMEVISLFQETELSGYAFEDVDSLFTYHSKPEITDLPDKDAPTIQSTPEMFPDAKDSNGGALSGQNYCFGRHLIESAYYKPETPVASQNSINSDGSTARALVANMDVELWASNIKDYGEDVKPKMWMRYWIHKDSTFPVPGEFIGILVRPVATPPHVWWFQESSPFLYAGNWVETPYLTSGIVTEVTLEADRTDSGTGDLYKIKIQGCEIQIASSDFLRYSVGDRVAVLKMKKTNLTKVKTNNLVSWDKSFTTNDQYYLKDSESSAVINTDYIIVPMTYYKLKH